MITFCIYITACARFVIILSMCESSFGGALLKTFNLHIFQQYGSLRFLSAHRHLCMMSLALWAVETFLYKFSVNTAALKILLRIYHLCVYTCARVTVFGAALLNIF
jgi:hypothetical protein